MIMTQGSKSYAIAGTWEAQMDSDPPRKVKAEVPLDLNWHRSGRDDGDEGWRWGGHDGGGSWHRKSEGALWQRSEGLSAWAQPLSEAPCFRMKVHPRGKPSEKHHHKSYIMWNCRDFVSETLSFHLAYDAITSLAEKRKLKSATTAVPATACLK